MTSFRSKDRERITKSKTEEKRLGDLIRHPRVFLSFREIIQAECCQLTV